MSHAEECPCCRHRREIIKLFDESVKGCEDGGTGQDVMDFVIGAIGAVAAISAMHIVEGREDAERQRLQEMLAEAFDAALEGVLESRAAQAVKQ